MLELEEQAEMRRGTGAQIRVTGDTMVTETASDEDGPAVGPGAEETPRWRRAPQQGQAPPADEATQAGALDEPAAEMPDDGRRRQRD